MLTSRPPVVMKSGLSTRTDCLERLVSAVVLSPRLESCFEGISLWKV